MNGRCPVCNQQFDFKRLHVLFEQNGASLLHITCHNCFSSTLASVIVNQNGVNFNGIVTDLNTSDVLKYKDSETISAEYLLELHNEMDSNNLVF